MGQIKPQVEAEPQERRGPDRVPTDIGLTCRVPAQPSKARITDVSKYGCCVELATGHAEPGVTIVFDMPNGDRTSGQVMWSHGKKAGVRFSRALKPGTAVLLGLPDDRPIVTLVEPGDAAGEKPAGRGLSHWFRRIYKLFD